MTDEYVNKALQARIDLAFRRLQIALLRSGYVFNGETLESAVITASHVIEGRVEKGGEV